ncbi:vWA domain-containing protein [Maliponia aquimaris]|uniref:von Willebrand factor type A domain protein n=1 Tax=Maliponia aquimaris TaxID=1673631 RepID=A0A238KBB4_9RHOB|nr:vWA domain-containing protein [Maliponia aquimaris]SMX40150.1 von Willebrand factor type A domain protein [Maliponia aquimaris]
MHLLPRLAGLAAFGAALALPLVGSAGESCTEDAMIVFDGSGSMAEIGYNAIGVPRISEARLAMQRVIPRIAAQRRLGLVIYGPFGDRTCVNTDLRFSPMWQAAPRILADVEALNPAGGTSLTESVKRAAEALHYRDTPGTVVVVTDGKETCGGAPCQLAAEIAAIAPWLTVHVIGFKVRGDHFDWSRPDDPEATTVARCLADETGGKYVRAETVDELIGALQLTLGCTVMGSILGQSVVRLR